MTLQKSCRKLLCYLEKSFYALPLKKNVIVIINAAAASTSPALRIEKESTINNKITISNNKDIDGFRK